MPCEQIPRTSQISRWPPQKTVFMHFRPLDGIFSYYNATALLKNIKNAAILAIIQTSILKNCNMATKMTSA